MLAGDGAGSLLYLCAIPRLPDPLARRPTPKSRVSQIAEESDGAVQTIYSGVGSRFLLRA
jgi:hypothetical protein